MYENKLVQTQLTIMTEHTKMPDAEADRKSVHGPSLKLISLGTTLIVILAVSIPQSRATLWTFISLTSEITTIHPSWVTGIVTFLGPLLIWVIIWLLATMNTQDDENEE